MHRICKNRGLIQYTRPVSRMKTGLAAALMAACILVSLIPDTLAAQAAESGSATIFRNADAVNRLVEKDYDVKPDGSFRLHIHVITDIHTYKGVKDHADFKYPYNRAYESLKVNLAQTRTADGRIMRVSPKEIQDIQDPSTAKASIYSSERLKVIDLPAVEAGSTIEIDLTLDSSLGFWATESFRLLDPTVSKKVTVHLPENMQLSTFLPDKNVHFKKTVKDGKAIYIWQERDLPKIKEERLSPPLENQGSVLIMSTFGSWKQTALFFKKLLDHAPGHLDDRDLPAPFSRTKTVDDLYMALMKSIVPYPIDLFKTSMTLQSPLETIRRGYGTPADLALLFSSLSARRGLKPEYFLTGYRGLFLERLRGYSPLLFNDVLVKVNGKFYCFDNRDLPPGITGRSGETALCLNSGRLEKIRDYAPRTTTTILRLRPAGVGIYRGEYLTTFTGAASVEPRGKYRDLSTEEWRIAGSILLHSVDPAARLLGKAQHQGLDDPRRPLSIRLDFSIPAGPACTGDTFFLRIPAPKILQAYKFCRPDRENPLFIRKETTEIFKEEISLPTGYKIIFSPKPSQGKSEYLSWKIKSGMHDGKFIYFRKIHLKRSIITTDGRYKKFLIATHKLLDPARNMLGYAGYRPVRVH